ncbi:DUF1501 domain-containing protein [Lignipirellula cremea]|uniref:Sulfatase n=1 Tax=Lignipirellula cremea TaxID=2528010 RepID=A0A518DT62_9BACT|nr:DUF1501 domain-containing protein [Lignipirellula cremea]QDU95032.1 hypothetical protein Pla8534_28430 [Lignipirellula cremea]
MSILVPPFSRRRFLEVGSAGLLGLTLPALLRWEAQAKAAGTPAPRAKNIIFYWCQGGPPHQDMWDMKPNAPAEVRGEFNPIATDLPGYQVCELMPHLSKQIHKLSIVRGVNHHIPDHNPGSMFMLGSGNAPNATTFFPTYSAVVQKETPSQPGLPTTVAIPSEPSQGPGPGFLGPAYRSFEVQGDPNEDDFKVRSISMPDGVDRERMARRRALLQETNGFFNPLERRPPLLQGLDQFSEAAHDIVLSESTREAFRIEKEPDSVRERYGREKLGQRMLLGRRLIEAGVRFVTITDPYGWDTHGDNFNRMRKNIPIVDQCFSALLEDLDQRGLLQETLVMMFGEFGRTPKINKNAGRDHWPQAMSIILAGAGLPGGLVYGETDDQAAYVTDKSHSPADFACTLYRLMGIDPHRTYPAGNDQPTPIVRGGEAIRALL